MSKFIYSPTSNLIESTYQHIKEADQATNGVYRSIGITGDGYMYTHGKKFRLFEVVNDALTGVSFSINNGTAQLLIDGASAGSGTVVLSISDDTIIKATTTNGAVALAHKQYINISNPTQYGSASKIPIITVDKYGHITAVSLSNALDLTLVKANVVSATGNYYLTGVTDANAQNPVYSTNAYIDKDGKIYGKDFYLNGSALSTLFAPLDHTSVQATASVLGHVSLNDTADNTKDVTSALAATPKAVYQALSAAKSYADDLVSALDSMIFVGTIDSTGVIKAHNSNVLEATDNVTNISSTNYKVGWTFRFTDTGTFNGNEVEPGDMLIAVRNKSNNFAIADWTIIQTNISGALTSPNTLSGILYANGSRTISALSFSTGVLTSNGSSISFVDKNTLWRTIKVKDTSIGTNELNLKEGNYISLSAENGVVTIAAKASDIIGTASALTITKGSTLFSYSPSSAADLAIGGGLSLAVSSGAYTLSHSTVSSTVSAKLGKITTDSYGHITGFTEVTSLKNPNSLTIKDSSTNHIVYDGSAAKVLQVNNGTDISLTLAASGTDIVLTPSITHRYRPISFYATSNAASATALIANNASTTFTLVGGDNVTLSTTDGSGQALAAGTLRINAADTWRAILAYKFSGGEFTRSSIGSGALKFGPDFIFTNDEIDICWTEIDNEGRVTYVN